MNSTVKHRLLIAICLAAFAGASFLAYHKYKELNSEADEADAVEAVEEAADVTNPKRIARAGFSLEHPGNWEIDTEDADYEADHVFWMDTPGKSWVLFIVYDEPVKPEEILQEAIEDVAPELDMGDLAFAKRSAFTQWGGYLGMGNQLHRDTGDASAVTARFFAFSSAKRSFVVVERYVDADLPMVQPGLDMVRSSFKLKE